MKIILKIAGFLTLSITLFAYKTDTKVQLLNGITLDNWNIFVSSPDVQPEDLFWVEDGIINTSGKPHGYIRTKESYSN